MVDFSTIIGICGQNHTIIILFGPWQVYPATKFMTGFFQRNKLMTYRMTMWSVGDMLQQLGAPAVIVQLVNNSSYCLLHGESFDLFNYPIIQQMAMCLVGYMVCYDWYMLKQLGAQLFVL
ncbi:hypothetical protein FRACYDRAFT_241477 [Fragilariopsis cylindrus CCMP1102]|uniref:Uncharacterized protein n=1 Tax=Fragilariopsis cylindrus CCMP1102 TaxID=635003 RepID=A0A1E7F9V6_9STRA|nr:hypothetical protein FRACYDRAFT_241477 [Fragilariopsis cylindrus CCMP1102]|eukprot:OEU14919.1 hypothetical protein FRACYDRAFT_241477 [Fragilariopsis cylindrus CCMP1102]